MLPSISHLLSASDTMSNRNRNHQNQKAEIFFCDRLIETYTANFSCFLQHSKLMYSRYLISRVIIYSNQKTFVVDAGEVEQQLYIHDTLLHACWIDGLAPNEARPRMVLPLELALTLLYIRIFLRKECFIREIGNQPSISATLNVTQTAVCRTV